MRPLLLCALLALLGVPASADPLPPEVLVASKLHYGRGAAFYQEGKYAEALVEFTAAYRLSHLPDLLFNLGRVAERMEQPAEAADYLERYLKERPGAADRADIERDLERLRKAAEPPPPPVQVAPPPPVQVAPPPPAPAAPPPRRTLPWPALGVLGGGAALLIVGIATGGAALGAAGQVQSAERFDATLDARGRSLQGAAIFFDVIGALALAGGATWTALHYLRPAKASPKEALRVAPAGAGLVVLGSF